MPPVNYVISLSMPREVADAARREVERDSAELGYRVSLTAWIVRLIRQELARRGRG